jgi:hypothetical protein
MRKDITYKAEKGYIEGMLKNGYTFKIDLEDYPVISRYSWYQDGDGYLRNKGLGYMHRFLADTPEGLQTDHINRERNDNRKQNLRHATQYENQLNRERKNHVGVYQEKRTGRWQAYISKNKKRYHLGMFASESEAIEARKKAEQALLGTS